SARVQTAFRPGQGRSAGRERDQRGSCAASARRPGTVQTRDAEKNDRVRKEKRRKRFGLGAVLDGLAPSHRRWSRERRAGRPEVVGSSGEERCRTRGEETRSAER